MSPLSRDGAHDEAGYSLRGTAGGMADAVMDLTAEDAKEMAAGQRRFHWDKRHKRYVQLQDGEKLRSTGKRKTESGATVRSEPVRRSQNLETLRRSHLRCEVPSRMQCQHMP